MAADTNIITALTLNCWGVPYVAKKVKERALHLVDYLTSTPVDVVGLQEVFEEWHADLLTEKCKVKYPYSHWFRSGMSGSPGLLVLSRYPIISVEFLPFTLNGYPQHLHHGDWLAGKGVGKVRIKTPATLVDVYNTHLHANYDPFPTKDITEGHRITQHYEMGKYISQHVPVIALGDFNTVDTEISLQVFKELSCLSDSYRDTYPDATTHPGYTNDTPECSWRLTSRSAKLCSNNNIKRIDYVFYSKEFLKCASSENCCGAIQGQDFSYSDHIGVKSVFEVLKAVPSVTMTTLTPDTLAETMTIINTSLRTTYRDIRDKLRILFVLSLVWLACFTVAVFEVVLSPYMVVILSNAITAAITTLSLYLLFFCRSEVSKFKEFFSQLNRTLMKDT